MTVTPRDRKTNRRQRRFAGRLAAVPLKPGVYLHRDRHGNLLYVGKASVLRSRLRSYFQNPTGRPANNRRLGARTPALEYILTASGQEALAL